MRFQSDFAVINPTEYNPLAIALCVPRVQIGERIYSTIPTREKIDDAVTDWGAEYMAGLDDDIRTAAYQQVETMGGIGRAACYVYEEWQTEEDALLKPPEEIVVDLRRHDLMVTLEAIMCVLNFTDVRKYLAKKSDEIDEIERLTMQRSVTQFLIGRDLLAELHKRLKG